MRLGNLALILAMAAPPTSAWAQTPAEIQETANTMVRLCLGGGSTEAVTKGVSGGAQLSLRSLDASGNLKGEFKVSKSTAEGLVDGINNAMTKVAADQADKVRDCLAPVRQRLLDVMLPPHPGRERQTSPEAGSRGRSAAVHDARAVIKGFQQIMIEPSGDGPTVIIQVQVDPNNGNLSGRGWWRNAEGVATDCGQFLSGHVFADRFQFSAGACAGSFVYDGEQFRGTLQVAHHGKYKASFRTQ